MKRVLKQKLIEVSKFMAYPYTASPYQNNPRPILTILDLLDVNLSSLTNGQVLKYNGTTGKWENSLDLNTTEAAAPLRGVQFNNGGLLTGSNNFLFTTSNQLQLGSQAATSKLHISDISEQEASLSLQNLSTNGKEYKVLSSDLGSLQIQDVSTGLFLSFSNGDLVPGQDITQNLGSASLRWSDIYGQNAVINTSDKSQKKDIEESDLGLDFILNLKPISFRWHEGKRKHYGLIAQDVKESLGIQDFGGYIYDPESKVHGLRYTEFIAPLIKSVQEINNKIKTQYFTTVQLIQESNKDLTQSIPIRLNNIDLQLQGQKEILKDLDKVKYLQEKHHELNHLLYSNKLNIESQIKDLKVDDLKETHIDLKATVDSQIKTIQILTEKVESLEESNKTIHQYLGKFLLGQNKVNKQEKQIIEPVIEEKIKKETFTIEQKESPDQIEKTTIIEWFKGLFKNLF